MKTTLSHLPDDKQKEILEILEIIKEEAQPEKVILFGSHAKGNWVEDEYVEDGITYTYISDYDFLVVIKKNGIKEQAIISHIENRCEGYKNVVSPIVHDIDYINQGLQIGQYFFTEIIQQGILLYDSKEHKFSRPKNLSPKELAERANGYYTMWFPSGKEYLIDAQNAFTRGSFRHSTFYLHQAAECFYSTILLVFTGYKPKTHNLSKLRSYSKHISGRIYNLFSMDFNERKESRDLFEILRKGYIEARYDPSFNVTSGELEALINKLKTFEKEAKNVSLLRIEKLNAGV